jgi:hypothetical protein
MSSLRRIQSSKSNGALSKGPSTPAGKERSSLNAIRHGLCAKCIVVEGESRENFLILVQQHVDRFRPADEVEFGMIEEMCASYWRQRRAWSLETGMFNKQMALQPDAGMTDRMMDSMVVAFDALAASHSLSLLHRYETRLHLMYQRALRTLIMLRPADMPNDPSPISEHSPEAAEQPLPPPPDVGHDAILRAGCEPTLSQPTADSESLIWACQSWLQAGFQPVLARRTPPLPPPARYPPQGPRQPRPRQTVRRFLAPRAAATAARPSASPLWPKESI